MAELIEVREEQKPEVICGHCKEKILIDIKPFAPDPTKILSDRCPKCHGEIVVSVLILSHTDMRKLLITIQTIIDTLKNANLLLK